MPHAGGLGNCYIAAIPFFRNTLISDLAYAGILFGAHALLSRTVAQERVPALAA